MTSHHNEEKNFSQSKVSSHFMESYDFGSTTSEEEKIGLHSFKIINLIGKGSFGEVYIVEKKNTKNRFAMKVLHKKSIFSKK